MHFTALDAWTVVQYYPYRKYHETLRENWVQVMAADCPRGSQLYRQIDDLCNRIGVERDNHTAFVLAKDGVTIMLTYDDLKVRLHVKK